MPASGDADGASGIVPEEDDVPVPASDGMSSVIDGAVGGRLGLNGAGSDGGT